MPAPALRAVVIGAGADVWPLHRQRARGDRRAWSRRSATAIGARPGRWRAQPGPAAAHSLGDLLGEPADLAVVLTTAEPACRARNRVPRGGPARARREAAGRRGGGRGRDDRDRRQAAAAARRRAAATHPRGGAGGAARCSPRASSARSSGSICLATWPRRSDYFEVAPWRAAKATSGGGLLLNQAQHDLDLICHLCGPPARVTARLRTALHPVEAEDTAAALLEWPGGALGALHVSSAEADELQRIEVTGTGGRLRLTYGHLEIWRTAPDFREHAADAEAIRSARPPSSSCLPCSVAAAAGTTRSTATSTTRSRDATSWSPRPPPPSPRWSSPMR